MRAWPQKRLGVRRGAGERRGKRYRLTPEKLQAGVRQNALTRALRRFLFFAHEGKVRHRHAEQQTDQILCLNLVTNAVVTWNTVYMEAALAQLRAEGVLAGNLDLSHLSPALYGHLNPYGKYRFDLDEDRHGAALRPLRTPGDDP